MKRLPGVPYSLSGRPAPAVSMPLSPVRCQHRDMSRAHIVAAASETEPGQAVVLGAGACEEIPLDALASRFESVLLIDTDPVALDAAVAGLPARSAARVHSQVADLAGLGDEFLAEVEACLHDAGNEAEAVAALCRLAGAIEPRRFELARPCQLVIASCVVTQLHLYLYQGALWRVARRFPGLELEERREWVDAMLRLALRMQEEFLASLPAMIAAGGRIYVSATVQAGEVACSPDGAWTTAGWYRMTRERFLHQCLGPDYRPLRGGQWPWVAVEPRPDAPGLVYNVHAVTATRSA